MSDGGTLSATVEPAGPSELRSRPHLFLVLQSHNLRAAPARIALDGVDEVLIGRGERSLTRKGARVEIRLDDPWLSSHHAAFVRVLRRWALEDRGAKNGCFLDGVRVERAELTGGEIVEFGHSFFLFAEAAVADVVVLAVKPHQIAARPSSKPRRSRPPTRPSRPSCPTSAIGWSASRRSRGRRCR